MYIDRMKVMNLARWKNYHGRWDVLIGKCMKCFDEVRKQFVETWNTGGGETRGVAASSASLRGAQIVVILVRHIQIRSRFNKLFSPKNSITG